MSEIVNFIMCIFGVALLVLFMVFGVILLIKAMTKEVKKLDNTDNTEEQIPQEEKLPYTLNNPMMSQKEKSFYRAVKPIADELGFTVFTKVRLADLLTVPKDSANYRKWFNHIKAKHVDFVLVDKDMNIKAVIEVDDKTHQREDRKERDEFVDKAFKQAGIEVLHIYSWGNSYGGVNLKDTIVKSLNDDPKAPAESH